MATRRAWIEPAATALGCLLLAGLLSRGVLGSGATHEAFHDWDLHLSKAEAAARAVATHAFPFWDPYPCGGMPLLAHPESRILTPFFLLHLALAPARALRWEIALHIWIAVAGIALLIRHLLADRDR